MKHVGHDIQRLLLENGISITHTAKYMGIQRSTLYNLFERPQWPLHRVQAIERLTNRDLRSLYPHSDIAAPNSYIINREQGIFLQEEVKRYRSMLDEAWIEIDRLRAIIDESPNKP